MKQANYISFREGVLNPRPSRLPIFYQEEGLLVLDKPLDVLVDTNPWFPQYPAIIPALRNQIQNEKKELAPYLLKNLQSLLHLEPKLSGLALIATNTQAVDYYRNKIGSETVQFNFKLLAHGSNSKIGDVINCDLPLAKNPKYPKMHVSHRFGKKTKTTFSCIDTLGPYSWWLASTHFYRMHQVALHAFESGIHIVGDPDYSNVKNITLSQLTHLQKPSEKTEEPIYPGICLDLVEVKNLVSSPIIKPLHKKLHLLDKKLRKYLNL